MTREEFEEIIKPIYLMSTKDRQFMRSSLLGNFDKWNEKRQCNTANVLGQSEHLCDNPHCEDGIVDTVYGHPIHCHVCDSHN